jgi:PAS domain S-box-containing protein
MMLDSSFRYVRVNHYLAKVRGLDEGDFIGRTVEEVIPDLWLNIEPILRRVLAGETLNNYPVSEPFQQGTNEARHWLGNYHPMVSDGNVVGIACIAVDVTKLRMTEIALRLRTDLYAMLSPTNRAVSESTSARELYQQLCEIVTATGKFLFAWVAEVEDGDVEIGASVGVDEQYVSETILSLDEGDPHSKGPTVQALLRGEPVVVNDFTSDPATAPWHDLARSVGFNSNAAFPIREGGHVVAALTIYATETNYFTDDIVSALTDIMPVISYAIERFAQGEERHKRQLELEQRDRAITAISQGIVITDTHQDDNPIIFASKSFERLTGYTQSEILGRNCRFLQGEKTDPRSVNEIRHAIENGEPRTIELVNYRKDGTTFWNSLSITPVVDDTGVVTNFVGVQTDVSERRNLAQQLLQSQKMEAVGTLAAGIAHDFNNMLLVVRGYNDLLAKRVVGDELKGMTERIEVAVQQAADITRRLLAFSRQQDLQPEPTDLNQLLTQTIWLWQRMLGVDIVLRTDLDHELPFVTVDRSQFEQAVVNLITNACDAMPNGGVLHVRTSSVVLDDAYAHDHDDVRAGAHALVEMIDNGSGMDEDTKSRIFEPFFTTKPSGSGLGLATVYGIVRQCGGHLRVESSPGQGTAFRIYLPISDVEQPMAQERNLALPVQGDETILVVEDVDSARELLVDGLREFGYTVISASNGNSALELARTYDATIDVLLTDIAMPQMNGQVLARRLLDRHENLKILFTSGLPTRSIVLDGQFRSRSAFVEKPYLLSDMVRAVRELLD